MEFEKRLPQQSTVSYGHLPVGTSPARVRGRVRVDPDACLSNPQRDLKAVDSLLWNV